MEDFKVLYKRFLDDARTIAEDEAYMTFIEKKYDTKLQINLKNIYDNSPSYYSKITSSQEVFKLYQLWFLTIVIIDNATETDLEGFNCKNDILKWTKSRKDPNIPYFIVGPLRNQAVKNDFISHYRNIMDSQNSIQDISQYLQLTSLQSLNIESSNILDAIHSRPNAYDKLPDTAKSFIVNISSSDSDVSIIDGMTMFDCSKIDLKDITEVNIIPRFKDLQNVSVSKIVSSKIPIKKFEMLFNTYSRIFIKNLELEHNIFQIDIRYCKNAFVVFKGIYANERNVYSGDSIDSLAIEGHFEFNNERNVYMFYPKNEFLTFRGLETLIKNLGIYFYFPGIGNINMTTSLILSQENLFNVDIFNNSSLRQSKVGIVRKYVLPSSIVISDGEYIKQSREDVDSFETSNAYEFFNMVSREVEYWKGSKRISQELNMIYDTFDERIYRAIFFNNNSIMIRWTNNDYKFPCIFFYDTFRFDITDDFQLLYGQTIYDRFDITFSGSFVILNGKIIKTDFTTNSKEKHIMIEYMDSDTIHLVLNDKELFVIERLDNGFMISSERDFYQGIDKTPIGNWLIRYQYRNEEIETYKISKEPRYDLIPNLIMRSDLSEFYEEHRTESFPNYEKVYCSGVLVNNEYYNCVCMGLIGLTVYIYVVKKHGMEIIEKPVKPNSTITIFPIISSAIIKHTPEREIMKFFVYSSEGYYLSDSEYSNLIAYYRLSDDESVLVCVDINASGTISLMTLNENGCYDNIVMETYGRAHKMFYKLIENETYEIYDYSDKFVKKIFIGERSSEWIQWPLPIPTNVPKDFFRIFSKTIEEYSPIELLKTVVDRVIETNCLNRYSREYGKYPLIKTDHQLCVNKEYSLTIDDEVVQGIVIKNNEYYSFCRVFDMLISTRIIMKIRSDLFTMSIMFD